MAGEAIEQIQRLELLQVADAVARDKSIDREEVVIAMEQAIQKAGRSKYGHEHDIRAEIDRKSGDIKLYRYRQVVETIENEATQLTLEAGRKLDAKIEIIAQNWSLRRMAPTDRNALRLGAYELLYTQTPPRVVIDEALELAKLFGSGQSAQFVNGILDRLITPERREAMNLPGAPQEE